MKVKIKTYNGDLPYLTPEKEYEVIERYEFSFVIQADKYGTNLLCLLEDCDHLNGGSWEIVTESHSSTL